MPRYRLLSQTGDDLGPFHAATPTWAAGDVITRGPGNQLIVIRLTEPGPADEHDGYLVVRVAE